MSQNSYNPKNGIVLRGISKETVSELDRKASDLSTKLGKRVTRQDYIKLILEGDNARPIYELRKELVETTIDQFSNLIEQQAIIINQYIDSNERLINLLTGSE